jgi:uncharacterized membrane protein YdcZ (DUF606 family)
MPPLRLSVRLWLGGLAAGGAAVAHLLAFMVAAPDAASRVRLLRETGHGAWPAVVSVAVGALVVGLLGLAAARLRDTDPLPKGVLYRASARLLLPLQVVGFVVLEAVERVATGKGVTGLVELWGEPVIALGVVLQCLVALAGAFLVVLVVDVVDGLVSLRTPVRAPRTLAVELASVGGYVSHRNGGRPGEPRAPPSRM